MGTVTLKKGVCAHSADFWNWYQKMSMNTIDRQPVVIKLLDEVGSPTMTWTLQNAWPTKWVTKDLDSEAREVTIESLEIAHEGLEISSG